MGKTKLTPEELAERQRERCRVYWAAHREEIAAKRKAKREKDKAEKQAREKQYQEQAAAFPRRDLLPAPRKALRHRSREQNLHRNSAPPLTFGRHFRGAICSPLPAKPCATVPGSKIFTEIPRHRMPGGRPCCRRPSDKAIYHRRATPTGRPKSRPAADHVGAAPPAKP